MALVLVDVDGTLVPPPSGEARFIAWLIWQRMLGARQLAAAAWFQVRWMPRFGLFTHRRNKAYLSGLSPEAVESVAASFVAERIAPHLRPNMRMRLQAHHALGDQVALLTGTPEFIARPLARRLGINLWVATLPSKRNGRFTAALPHRHPYAAEKIACAEALCADLGVRLAEAVAYADSGSDVALLERVGRPVAVHPDTPLRAAARTRGWEIIKDDRATPAHDFQTRLSGR
jgi:HAD superfamily hydrolase (TIGR01490 family)